MGLAQAVALSEIQPTQIAWDLLSVALAVSAADTFTPRTWAADNWTRQIEIVVAVSDPKFWSQFAVAIANLLTFLSGDYWSVQFEGDGHKVPKAKKSGLTFQDSVCLFSGGLDSLTGAIDLVKSGANPVLVSHAYVGDSQPQSLAKRIRKAPLAQFRANADPHGYYDHETSMRARSFLFLAMGTVAASALQNNGKKVELRIAENGFISLNVPLGPDRIGSLSTRTTHPHFLAGFQSLLDNLGIPVQIANPYQFLTKGNLLGQCADQSLLRELAHQTISCGKKGRKIRWENRQAQHWKAGATHCGRCVPCIIRRASFHAWGYKDDTIYEWDSLKSQVEYEDVAAFRYAISRAKDGRSAHRVVASAPFPALGQGLSRWVTVYEEGLKEVSSLFSAAGLK